MRPETESEFLAEHEQIMRDAEWMRLMAQRLPQLPLKERRAVIEGTLERLRRVGRQAAAEERLLYPALAQLLGTPKVGDAMTADHRFVHARMQYLAETDLTRTAALQAILYGLHAVITTHVHKEDEILMPLVARLRQARAICRQLGEPGSGARSARTNTRPVKEHAGAPTLQPSPR